MWIIPFRKPRPKPVEAVAASPDPLDRARLAKAAKQLLPLCVAASQTSVDLKHWNLNYCLKSLHKEVAEWPNYFPMRTQKQQQKGFDTINTMLSFLPAVTPLLDRDTDTVELRKWTKLVDDAGDALRHTRLDFDHIDYPESLRGIGAVLATLPEVSIPTKIERFRDRIESLPGTGYEDLLSAGSRLREVAKEWESHAEDIKPASRKDRGDFLLKELINACDTMTGSDKLTMNDRTTKQMVATMNQVSSFLETTLTTARVSDETGLLLRLSALQTQASI